MTFADPELESEPQVRPPRAETGRRHHPVAAPANAPFATPTVLSSTSTLVAMTVLTAAPPGRPARNEFLRYFAASVVALCLDMGLYAAAWRAGMPYGFAALLGFAAGAAAAYYASVRWVFQSRSVQNPTFEFGLFIAVGAAGLLLTEALLWVFVDRLACPPILAKLGTAGFVFVFNFALRKALLFRASAR